LMMENNFICASANLETPDEEAAGLNIPQTRIDNIKLDRILSNSFGFGGTNASLVFERYQQ
jgi:3-oxoacyl-[acyl-carrier-protein] synthase-1